MGRYVNAWSGDVGEELDQQRVVVGGMVTGIRRVITKARATMAVATLEDLQGSLDVVVFPQVYEETSPTWVEDAVLLVAGRVDHKGDETVLLADSVWTWEEATALGPEAFARAVAAGDRGRRGRDRSGASTGAADGTNGGSRIGAGNGREGGWGQRPPVAVPVAGERVGAPVPVAAAAPAEGIAELLVRTVPLVSPLRGGGVTGTIDVVIRGALPPRAPAAATLPGPLARPALTSVPASGTRPPVPLSEPPQPGSLDGLAPETTDEPPWPDEARAQVQREAAADTAALEAAAGRSLHVRFGRAPQEAVVSAFATLRELFGQHAGETPVILHVPAGGGREQEMQLRAGVAYDAELVADVRRRLGTLVELSLV